MLFFWTFYLSNDLESKSITILAKILRSTTIFNIDDDNNKKCFLGTKSFQWFLKDHVTLKIGVMAAENSALPLQE